MKSALSRRSKIKSGRPFGRLRHRFVDPLLLISLLLFAGSSVEARFVLHSTGILQGTITDTNGAAIPGVDFTSFNLGTGLSYSARSDGAGFYQFVVIPVGTYQLTSQINGFKTQIVNAVDIQVGNTTVIDLQLAAGDINEKVTIEANAALVNLDSVSVGQVISERTIQDIPLNGRYFVDLGLLVPGSVTPPQNANLAAPTRGLGS